MEANAVDLIYLDPPFFTQDVQRLVSKQLQTEFSFSDKWDSMDDYLEFMGERLKECRRTLKNTGSIFVHCDRNASHYLKVLMDKIFGMVHFQSEIIWTYKRWSNSKKGLLNNHQVILFYSKTQDFKFNKIYTNYSETTNIDQILQERIRDGNGKSVYKTDENDLVLDPFAGSGTTLVAARMLHRKYIGIDISKDAVELAEERLKALIKTESFLLKKGKAAYQNLTENQLSVLKSIGATPVQRNSGIDGFLSEYVDNKPVSVKIQKQEETLEAAADKLVRASKTKKCEYMVLIRTHIDRINPFDFVRLPKGLILLDSYEIQINDMINAEVKRSQVI